MPPDTVRVVHPTPDVRRGVEYWTGVPATVDGVLGGFGNGTLPRIDALGSRTFLLRVLPFLSSTPPSTYNGSPREWLAEKMALRGGAGVTYTRALDCGAGVGRVSEHSLLPLVDEVHLVEPVHKFLVEAKQRSAQWQSLRTPIAHSPLRARKCAYFHTSTLQDFPIATPSQCGGRVIEPAWSPAPDEAEENAAPHSASPEPLVYDVVWSQWCLQHLSETDLLRFLRNAQKCLRPPSQAGGDASLSHPGGVIVVKENVCKEEDDGTESTWYDEEDFSVTRCVPRHAVTDGSSRQVFERLFREAGLTVVRTDVQLGFPDELFAVHMCAPIRVAADTRWALR